MRLITELLDEMEKVSADDVERILAGDSFGRFVVLSDSEDGFIQAACDWQPTDDCRRFLERYGSDPWVLEYRDGRTDKLFRAPGHVTLERVREVFTLFLSGIQAWREVFQHRTEPLSPGSAD